MSGASVPAPFLDRIKGGSFGDGLAGNIRRAYKFLSFYYQPGDHVFIFGFSRGAYTARSLVGYISAAGLLRREKCTPKLESKTLDYYRTAPNDRMPGIWTELTPSMNDRDELKIDCLGVFDTVGALGVPLPAFYRVNRERYEFHNVELSSITKVNLHAIAMDEHREPFGPRFGASRNSNRLPRAPNRCGLPEPILTLAAAISTKKTDSQSTPKLWTTLRSIGCSRG